ncbi:MAG: protein phosphatase 2C domain-containing protein [Clostridia bacterium]|nr:protein phosphatase 2C domain-containing protein [Clostridia bacterium]
MLDFDSVSVCGEKQGGFDSIGVSEESYCSCFMVADGKTVPGFSNLVVKTVLEDFQGKSEISTSTLPQFFDHAQEKLTSFQTEDLSPGGVATAVLLTDGDLALWAHIGDCRIYHLQDRLLYEITPDHSASYARFEAGELRYPKIRTDRLRQKVTRLMGMEQNFVPAFSKPIKVRKNDSFLVCTDGFWENIHERQIERCLKHSRTAKDWLKKMQKIVEKNRSQGKYTKVLDDYSAIVVRI